MPKKQAIWARLEMKNTWSEDQVDVQACGKKFYVQIESIHY